MTQSKLDGSGPTLKDYAPPVPLATPAELEHSLLSPAKSYVYSKSDINLNYYFTLAVPEEYNMGFIGRAFVMENNKMEPNFKVALSVEAIEGKFSCSLEVFLGDVRVWNSGHYSRFYVSNKCVLELTGDGDLRLKGPKERVGWRTGTSGQGVQRLQILKTGNLVLVDALNRIKWQSFNFPTDVMLWGQKLNVATRLTSFPTNSTSFYSLQIENNRIAVYLNIGKLNYSYWEFKASKNRNITFIELGSKGLMLFNDKHKKIAQIPSHVFQPLRFLALGNRTGNLGLYFYSPSKAQFEASFQALNTTCDLPLACKPYGICTFSNACSCIREDGVGSNCDGGFPRGFCGGEGNGVEMLELKDVSSVLRVAPKRVNVSKEECEKLCLDDCRCASAAFSSGAKDSQVCFLYEFVGGLKQVDRRSGMSYMVKVPKGTHGVHEKSNVKKWVLILVGIVDGFIILLVLGGLGYYLVRKRKRNLLDNGNDT
ncbi:PAN domain-containing protein [Morus notabilis]|uniref:PAN domain-containing protein n=1 Tax=Morus notabilis TaxID=981085 RepID=W9QMK7_9ROSA|nr:PAN domain-containing protein [Morus notabilis]